MVPSQKFVDDKILNYQYQQSKNQLDLYRNQPTILKPTMLSPPADSVNLYKNSMAVSTTQTTDQNSLERMKYLVSKIDRLEKENQELQEKSLYHEQLLNNIQSHNSSIAPQKYNYSVVSQPNQINTLQEQAEKILEQTTKLADEENTESPIKNYEKSKLLHTINRIKENLTPQQKFREDLFQIKPQKQCSPIKSPMSTSYYYKEKKKKSYCQNCANLLSKGMPTTLCLHR